MISRPPRFLVFAPDGGGHSLADGVGWISGPELIPVATLQALCARAGAGDVDGVILEVGSEGERPLSALRQIGIRFPDLPLVLILPDHVPIPESAIGALGAAAVLHRPGLTPRLLAEACARVLRDAAGRPEAPGFDPLVLEALPDPAALLDAAGAIVAVNRAWTQFGEENGLLLPKGGIGTNYLEVSRNSRGEGSEDGVAAAEGIGDVLAGRREHYRHRYPCHAPEQLRWFDLVATPVATLAWWAALVQHRNVTVDEQSRESARYRERRAEARLSAEQSLLEGVLRNASDAIYVKNLDGEFRLLNQAAANFLRMRPREAVGKRSADLLGPGRAAVIEQLDQAVMDSGQSSTVEEIMESGQGPRELLVTRSPYRGPNGQLLGVIGVAKDITAWRAAERAAAARQAHLTRIAELAPDGMITINARHEIVAFNPAAERMFGHSAQSMLGNSLELLLPARYRPQHHEHIAGFRDSGVTLRRMEDRHEVSGLRASGEEFPLEASIMQYTEGGDLYQSVIIRDLSERRRIEHDLEAARDQAREAKKLEAIGQLASGVAHDFNNALTVILAAAQIAREGVAADSPAAEELHQIELAAGHASALSRQLLAFGRRQVLKPVPLDIQVLLEEVEPMLRRAAGAPVELRLRLHDGPLWVVADPDQLQQVLMNLVVNARDAMPHGGVLTLATSSSLLHDGVAGSDAAVDLRTYCTIAITDTGVGMDAATLSRIFEPFFTTKGPGRGTGLGLATTYGIVKQSGGYILVESQPGKGSTFRVHLPRIEASGPVTTELAAAAPGKGATGATVMVVEDDPQIANVATRVLQRAGFRVITAPGPLEAVELMTEDPAAIDAVVSDVMMPDLNGIELRERLLLLKPGLRVLLVSGYAEGIFGATGGTPEGVTLLPKPYTAEQLRSAVHGLFQ